ncbi:MAG TPA: saccharopine dehydrogenase C-terminal domain-containing protein [Thermoanaerobaculia bacterium]|nr:saccharopine dehydrogenase C-terminal domain-containing protein [Thermoanaerobaculia bacterium]
MMVLGAGRMGLGAAHDLAAQRDVEEVTVADLDGARAEQVAARIRHGRVRAMQLDVSRRGDVVAAMRGHASAVSCVNYWLNEELARAAIEAGTNFCDLGGNNDVVDAELALDAEARSAGINIIPDCGLAPGMVAVLTAHGAARFEKLEEIHIRVGGLPQDPQPPLDYQLVFSVEGLINEYIERARVIRGGEIVEVESMTEVESLEFPAPFGTMEAFQTSGGTSTLPDTFRGKVRELDYKTIRFPGHCEKFKTMIDLGLCSSDVVSVDGVAVAPRRLLGRLLEQNLPADGPDVVLVRVELAGDGKRLTYDIIDRHDPETGLSAMMRTTAFPASIVALMMARGETSPKGALPQERCVPSDLFMRELARRRIDVGQEWRPWDKLRRK